MCFRGALAYMSFVLLPGALGACCDGQHKWNGDGDFQCNNPMQQDQQEMSSTGCSWTLLHSCWECCGACANGAECVDSSMYPGKECLCPHGCFGPGCQDAGQAPGGCGRGTTSCCEQGHTCNDGRCEASGPDPGPAPSGYDDDEYDDDDYDNGDGHGLAIGLGTSAGVLLTCVAIACIYRKKRAQRQRRQQNNAQDDEGTAPAITMSAEPKL